VAEVVVASPAASDGTVNPATLAACHVAGVDELWIMGGAQAIAALAHGTESIHPVEKIVGPGSAWVTAAKLAVFGVCSIDLPAGPSEVLVLADETAEARLVAVDLLCQAEHGPDSPAVLVTTDRTLPERVEAELDPLLPTLERSEILEQALKDHGWAVVVPDREAGIAFANDYAGEHVTIMTADPEADAKRVTAAGSVYIGRFSPESAGDYATGANHVLPTGGLAAACGPLSTQDFGSWRQEQRITREGLGASSIPSPPSPPPKASPPTGWRPRSDCKRTSHDQNRHGDPHHRETSVEITLDLDGTGATSVSTGVGFFDHLLTSFGHHGLFDLTISTTGDIHIDDHHTVEDTALVLGEAFAEALGDRSGISRFGDATVPMDEARATAVVDISGRPYSVIDLPFRQPMLGNLATQNIASRPRGVHPHRRDHPALSPR
jgi:imidazoleglycerol phosphate dehydratase HisB